MCGRRLEYYVAGCAAGIKREEGREERREEGS